MRQGGSISWALRNSPCSTAGVPLHGAAAVLMIPPRREVSGLGSPASHPEVVKHGSGGRGKLPLLDQRQALDMFLEDPPGLTENCTSHPLASQAQKQFWRLGPSLSGEGPLLLTLVPSPFPSLMAPCGLHPIPLASPFHSICS